MFNFFKKKSYCPFCNNPERNIITLNFEEVDKYDYHIHKCLEKRRSKIKLVINEDYRVYECHNCHTYILINGRDFIKVNEKINIIKKWYEGYSNIKEDLKMTIEEIGFSNLGESIQNVLPCKIRIGKKEQDFVTLITSKYLPIYSILYSNKNIKPENYFFIEDIDEIWKSSYAISKEIRTSPINAREVTKNYFPTILEGQKNEKVLIEGLTLFFNSQNIIGSDLKLSDQEWNESTDYVRDFTTVNEAVLLIRTKKGINNKNVTL